ncbi:hypothetical protein FQR65_LT12095 [Abscondita terminalis]|nr:hypothetical protein FQR65_LT12095 [Abscondita terminalis]
MSSTHLGKGSTNPEKVEGKLRLYSMDYCPYAQRVRLVLLAKGIPHDIVNINLSNKPKWYFDINPKGMVPALDVGDKIVVESLDIADYLEDQYPDPPLYPAEPHLREHEQKLIQNFNSIIGMFYKIVGQPGSKSSKEWLDELAPYFQELEDELSKRGSVFFGGENPGMVDYMIWPWGERVGLTTLFLGEKLPVGTTDFLKMRAWMKAMRKVPVAESMYHTPEQYHKVYMARRSGHANPYDIV